MKEWHISIDQSGRNRYNVVWYIVEKYVRIYVGRESIDEKKLFVCWQPFPLFYPWLPAPQGRSLPRSRNRNPW